jgi:class 3 adenylate cyclase/tetratricopeptide (TPR) repeat protein
LRRDPAGIRAAEVTAKALGGHVAATDNGGAEALVFTATKVATNICQWLEGLGLSRYADAFEANDIGPDLLPHISDQVLKDIGVASAGHRLRMLASISQSAPGGQPLRAGDAAAPCAERNDGERRQATVLVADISGYTTLCGRLDPEQVQALLGRFYEVTDGIIASYGGHVIDHAGDGTLASFGAPIAHDNDADRAVRAALDMQAQVAAITDPSGQALVLHTGIASGEVVAATIATGATPKYAVTGEAVNLAARLCGIANPGQTVIAEATWSRVLRCFDAEPLGERQVKGIDRPVSLWSVRGPRLGVAERRPFFGRQIELRQLIGVLDAAEAGRGMALCVRGEAGIGKSRLVEALREQARARGFSCHAGLVLDFGVGKRQDALAAIVKDVLGMGAQEEESALQSAVQRAVSGGLLSADQEVLINDLLELTQSVEQRAAFDAMDNSTRSRRLGEALIDIVQRGAARQPRLIVVEDLHWASADLLRHLAQLARAAGESRIVLAMTSRFEGYPLDNAWRAMARGCALTTVDLGPMRPDDCRSMAGAMLQCADRLIAECIERADGNPLFLEQLLRNAAESQASNLPASIQSLVLARMDRLDQRERTALQVASVLGKRFDKRALRALLGDRDYDCDALVDTDLAHAEGLEYVFAHALIQEGVYSSLLNSRKRELHKRAAEWFGSQEPILHAEHMDRAADPAAAEAYLSAARDQAARFRHESALRLVDRGLEIEAGGAVRCSLLLLRGDLLREAGRSSDSLAACRSALDMGHDDGQRCQALMGIAAAHRVTTDIPAALDALERAQTLADRLGDSEQLSRIHHVRGNLLFVSGDSVGCEREHGAAFHHAQEAANAECQAQALSGLGDAKYLQGRMLSGLDFFSRCVALCERAGLRKVQLPNRCMVGHCMYYANRMDESAAAIRSTLDDARRLGQAQTEIFALESLGVLLAWKGDYASAEQALIEGIPLARSAGARRYLAAMLCGLAEARLGQGSAEEALGHLDEALVVSQQSGMAFVGALTLSLMARAQSTPERARHFLAQAEEALRPRCLSHSELHFYRNAIDVSLHWQNWSDAARYAALLERYVRSEPLPWATLLTQRAHALIAAGSGESGEALRGQLQRTHAEIERVGFWSAWFPIDPALGHTEA